MLTNVQADFAEDIMCNGSVVTIASTSEWARARGSGTGRQVTGADQKPRSSVRSLYHGAMAAAKKTSEPNRKRGPAPALSIEQIVDAALRLIDAGGISALTTRRLGEEMAVGAMTIYSYVRTKEELLDRVADFALGAMVPKPDPALGWAGNLAAATRGIRRRLVESQGTLEIMLASRRISQRALDPARENMLAPLMRAGFTAESAVDAVTAAQTYAFGFAMAQRSHSGANPEWGDADACRFPCLALAGKTYSDRFSDRAFEEGLTDLLERIDQRRRVQP
jgi:AcrR family transcriptional regulator